MLPLFERYPRLQRGLPHILLGDWPSPVQHLERLGAELGLEHLYIKRDDLAGRVYGGNKVRKLEFLLGQARQRGAQQVITMGYAGANHAAATAIYARQLGLHSISTLLPQPNAAYVRDNLLLGYASGAELHYCPDTLCFRVVTLLLCLRQRLRSGRWPMVIPGGGTSPLGTMGFVNAALELKTQVEQGLLPEPDCLYVAMGTAGTAVGLGIGLKAAGLRTQVRSVRVADQSIVPAGQLRRHYAQTAALLKKLDPSFPVPPFTTGEIREVEDFPGPGYARFSVEGSAAVQRMAAAEEIPVDGAYTGKTLAALIRDAQEGQLRDRVVLFWHTKNTRDVSGMVAGLDYQHLPRPLQRYFEQEVQPLEQVAKQTG